MGLPYREDNADGYERARLSTKYEAFRNKTYLLVHGSLDDNVHYQQSMSLSRSLEVNDIPFEQIVSTAIEWISKWRCWWLTNLYAENHLFPDLSRRGSFIVGRTKAFIPCTGQILCKMPNNHLIFVQMKLFKMQIFHSNDAVNRTSNASNFNYYYFSFRHSYLKCVCFSLRNSVVSNKILNASIFIFKQKNHEVFEF